ncbi:MAG: P1 family peptidase [Ornithinimicrobium sp.]
MVNPGQTNSLVDVAGLRVGHYERIGEGWLTGTTAVLADGGGAVGGIDVRGGGPGTRETDLLAPHNLIERVNAICLCGGSAFGLAAADGVMRALYADGIGFRMGSADQVVPIVPAAVIFDLGRGGEFDNFPDASFGRLAAQAASREGPALGNAGAGTGAKAGGLKGGVGSASEVLPNGTTVAALVVVNSVGSTVDPARGTFYGEALLEPADIAGSDTGGTGEAAYPLRVPSSEELAEAQQEAARSPRAARGGKTLATTIGVVATDATLTKAQCMRVAGSGQDGLARAINPIHTMFDGDTVFGLSTARRDPPGPEVLHAILTASANVMTRAIVRGVLAAESVTTPAATWRSYRDAFPSVFGTGPSWAAETPTR